MVNEAVDEGELIALAGGQAGLFSLGDTLTVTAEVADTPGTDTDPDPGKGAYFGAILSLSVDFGNGIVVSAGPSGSNAISTSHAGTMGAFVDVVGLSAFENVSGEIDGFPSLGLSVAFSALGSGTGVLDGEYFAPLPWPDVSSIAVGVPNAAGGVTVSVATGQVSVPEPASGFLWASGAAGLAFASRRRVLRRLHPQG